MKENKEFKRVDTENERKLKYEGFCSKCNKDTHHRFDGGDRWQDDYRCMKCKTINSYKKPTNINPGFIRKDI